MRKYQPSNGTEGMAFIDIWCGNCIHESPEMESKHKCEILTLTMGLDVKDPEYPLEWCYDEKGYGQCTAFVKWDWGNDGDPNDPYNPKAPIPVSDKQLVFPFIVSDIEQSILETYRNPQLGLIEA
jgi:hypothetical protein